MFIPFLLVLSPSQDSASFVLQPNVSLRAYSLAVGDELVPQLGPVSLPLPVCYTIPFFNQSARYTTHLVKSVIFWMTDLRGYS